MENTRQDGASAQSFVARPAVSTHQAEAVAQEFFFFLPFRV